MVIVIILYLFFLNELKDKTNIIYNTKISNIYQLLLPIESHPINDKSICLIDKLVFVNSPTIRNNINAMQQLVYVVINLF